jgi:hypothetical protein
VSPYHSPLTPVYLPIKYINSGWNGGRGGGNTNTANTTSHNSQINHNNQNNPSNSGNNSTNTLSKGGTFKQSTPNMKGHVFECYLESLDRMQFAKTLEALNEYAVKNCKHPEDVKSMFAENMVACNSRNYGYTSQCNKKHRCNLGSVIEILLLL